MNISKAAILLWIRLKQKYWVKQSCNHRVTSPKSIFRSWHKTWNPQDNKSLRSCSAFVQLLMQLNYAHRRPHVVLIVCVHKCCDIFGSCTLRVQAPCLNVNEPKGAQLRWHVEWKIEEKFRLLRELWLSFASLCKCNATLWWLDGGMLDGRRSAIRMHRQSCRCKHHAIGRQCAQILLHPIIMWNNGNGESFKIVMCVVRNCSRCRIQNNELCKCTS